MLERFSITTEIIASGPGSYFIVRATITIRDQDTETQERYQSIGSGASPVDAEHLAIKRVHNLAGITKSGITDK